MAAKEHLVIEEEDVDTFTFNLDEASEEGFKVISSSATFVRINEGGKVRYENMYYALLSK